jgi:quinol monooxygenase YgiN
VIHVIAIITAHSGMRANILSHFHANVPAVRAEVGCHEYMAIIDAETATPFQTSLGPDTFVVSEKWENLDALHAHAVAPHVAKYLSQTKIYIASKVIHVLTPA